MTSSLRHTVARAVDWVSVAADLGRTIASPAELTDGELLQRVADQLRVRCHADLVTLVEPAPDGMLRVLAAAGAEASAWRDLQASADGSLSAPLLHGSGPRHVRGLGERLGNVTPITGIDDVLLLPLPGRDGSVRAVLTFGRRADSAPFADTDLVPAAMLAAQLGLAMQARSLAAAEQRRALADERDRIARVMQAQVIARLFTLGMTLQAAAGDSSGGLSGVLEAGSDEIDETIKAIRTTIYRVGN